MDDTVERCDGLQNMLHTEGANIVEEPKLGMVFNSEDELVSYYKKYGQQCGFGSMTRSSHRFEDGSIRYITLGCARGGNARNRTTNVARPRPTSKTGCEARISAMLEKGVLKVSTVNNSHNHGLSPQKSRFFRCHREVTGSVKRVLDINDQAGIRMNKSFASCARSGGYENLSFNEKDCRNYIDKARNLRLGKGGAGALLEYFSRMQFKNNRFFSLIERKKPTTKKTTQKEKHKELHGIEDEVTGTCRQLFGQTDVGTEQNVTVQLVSASPSPVSNRAMLAIEEKEFDHQLFSSYNEDGNH